MTKCSYSEEVEDTEQYSASIGNDLGANLNMSIGFYELLVH